jgi:membrane-associated HD superfamily phosphohydrolase
MNDRYARYGAATGMIFVGLVILGFIVQPKPPDADASAAEVLQYVSDHQNALHIVQLIFALAGIAFLWFLGALRSALAAAEGGENRLATTAYGAGLVAIAAQIVSFGLVAAAALHPVANGPAVTHALVDASLLVPAVAIPAVLVFFVANGISILRSATLPAWLGWLAILAAVFNALGMGAVFTDNGVFASDGVLGFFLGFVSFLIWIFATSLALFRGPEAEGTETATAPA